MSLAFHQEDPESLRIFDYFLISTTRSVLYSDDGCFPSVQIEYLLIHDFIFYMGKAEYVLTGFYIPQMCSDNGMDKQDFNS